MWNLACTIFYGEDCLCDQDAADISFAVIEILNFRVMGYLIGRKFHVDRVSDTPTEFLGYSL
jgi:hypothetical protein